MELIAAARARAIGPRAGRGARWHLQVQQVQAGVLARHIRIQRQPAIPVGQVLIRRAARVRYRS